MEQIGTFANLVLNPKGSTPIHHCIVSIHDGNGFTLDKVYGKIDQGEKILFKTGSISKIFTSTLILQLMEEGFLRLEDNFLDSLNNKKTKSFLSQILFVNNENYSEKIKIKDLLENKSGLRDYYSDNKDFLNNIHSNPNQQWDWIKTIEDYYKTNLHKMGVFHPSEDFYYSDTNYLLLAVLIEDLTDISYHDNLENRILKPYGLNDTYLEYFQDKKSSGTILYPFFGDQNLEQVNTSFDWGAGGLISSLTDLQNFIKLLLTGKLFKSPQTLKLLLNFEDAYVNSYSKNEKTRYGLGLMKKVILEREFYGHTSAYGGVLFHNIEENLTILLNLNQVQTPHKTEWLMKKIVEHFIRKQETLGSTN